MPKKKIKTDHKKTVINLEVKPLQLSFKDNLKKKITYFKSVDTFKYTKINDEEEDQLIDCLRRLEDKIEINLNNQMLIENQIEEKLEDKSDNDQLECDKNEIKKDNQEQSDDNKEQKDDNKEQKDANKERSDDKKRDKIKNKEYELNKIRYKKQMQLIKKDFVFGFNEIVRKLKDNQIIGIILASKLTSHVQQTVLELANNQNVPVLIASNIEFYQKFFKISRISSFALLINTKNEQSIFYEFNRTFFKINEKFSNSKELITVDKNILINEDSSDEKNDEDKNDLNDEDKNDLNDKVKRNLNNETKKELNDEDKKDLNDKVKKKRDLNEQIVEQQLVQQKSTKLNLKNGTTKKSKKSKRLKINHFPIDQLWIPKRDYKNLMNLKSMNEQCEDSFNQTEDLLLIKERKEDYYFPNRMYI